MPLRLKPSSFLTTLYLLAPLFFLYPAVFVPPFLPIASPGDSMLYLAAGQRLYQGEMIYRDFFEFVPPGTALLYGSFFKVFGLRPWIPNLLVLLSSVALLGLSVAISRKMMRPGMALLPGLLFLVWARPYITDPTHHWFSLLAVMAAIAVLIDRRTPARIALAGCLCGLGASFTQTKGVAALIGFAVFLWWESRQRQSGWRAFFKSSAWLVSGFAAAMLLVNGYFVGKAGPARFFWCTVVFPFKYYPLAPGANTFRAVFSFFPAMAAAPSHAAGFYLLFKGLLELAFAPLILFIFFFRYWRQSRSTPWERWQRPMLVAIVGAFVLMSALPAPADMRIASCSLPPLVLLGWLLDSPRKPPRALATLFAAAALLVALHAFVRLRPTVLGILTTPQGSAAFATGDALLYREYAWAQQHTRPGDYFYEASFSSIYFYLDLRNPTPLVQIMNSGYTTVEQVTQVVQGLEQHKVRYILWGPWAEVQLDRPAENENAGADHLGPLRSYLLSHYKLVASFGGDDGIWERTAG